MGISARVIGQTTFKDSLGEWYGNICLTPNGTRVARRGDVYYKINKDNKLLNKSKWYVGCEYGYELWQEEKQIENGEYRIFNKEIKIKS